MTFFKAEDFAVEGEWVAIPAGQAASIANAKLSREAKVVYGFYDGKKYEAFGCRMEAHESSHRALLICVEEIVKPKCEHAGHIIAVGKGIFRCADCKSEIKPTGWEVVE